MSIWTNITEFTRVVTNIFDQMVVPLKQACVYKASQ